MAESQFQETMLLLGYVLEEQDGLKLTYKKNAKYSIMILVIDLGLKYIDPILVPNSVVLYKKELTAMMDDFDQLRQDAKIISEKSKGKLEVLN